MSLLHQYPRTASLDYDGAIRMTLARWLADYPSMPLPGWVDDGTTCPIDGHVIVRPEWPDSNQSASWPGIVLLDAIGRFTETQLTPDIDEASLWPSIADQPNASERVGMRYYSEYVVDIPILIEGNDRQTRANLANAVTRALLDHDNFDECTEERYGLNLNAGPYFYNEPVRVLPQTLQRFDAALTAGSRVRRLRFSALCSIAVGYPSLLSTIQPPQIADPLEDGYLSVEA